MNAANTVPIQEIWVYLSGNPLLALVLTLGAYCLGVWAYERSGKNPLCNPVLVALPLITGTLLVSGMPYEQYFKGAQFIHFLLGPATVALAIPIFNAWDSLRGRLPVLLIALVAGGLTSVVSAVAVLWLMDADQALMGAALAKSLTAPIAMGVAERVGTSPTLTAVFAMLTGIVGAMVGRYVLNGVGVQAWWQRGFAMGVAAHGIGTSRAMSVHPTAGAYASVGMGLHGVLGAVVIPLVAQALTWMWA